MGDGPSDNERLVTLHRQGPALPCTIYRTECPACGYVVTAMSKIALADGLHTHQEGCKRG